MKKRCAIYVRKSTTKQSAETMETQIAECKKWAEDNDCIVVGIYDDSQSGQGYNTKKRDGFQRIKQDAKLGKMDYALIHKIDRFARSAADYFSQELILNEYGVKIVVVGMPFLKDADIITKSVHIAVAEQFSRNLSSEVSLKMRTFARKGKFLGGTPPFGFKVVEKGEDKFLEVNPEQVEAVKLIYKLYLDGLGYINISKYLAQNGYTNSKNEPFTPTFIRKVLTSKKYNGFYVYGVRETIKGKEKVTYNKEKLIEVPNMYEKIIDDETFNAVQIALESRTRKNRRQDRDYPLSGLITCGSCGRAYVGACTVQEHRNVKKYVYYRCNGYRVNECKMPGVRADYLEDFIAAKVKKFVFSDTFTENLIKEVESHLSGDLQSFLNIKSQLEKDLKEVNDQIKAAMKDKYKGKKNEDLYEEVVEELNQERETIENRLFNIEQQINVNDKTEQIRDYVNYIRNNFELADDDLKASLLRQVVNSVVITEENIKVYLNIAPSTVQPGRRYLNSLPSINSGVPMIMLDGQQEVYIEDGLNLLTFDIGSVAKFNLIGGK